MRKTAASGESPKNIILGVPLAKICKFYLAEQLLQHSKSLRAAFEATISPAADIIISFSTSRPAPDRYGKP